MKIYPTSLIFKKQIKIRYIFLPIRMPTSVAMGVCGKTGTLIFSGG